MPGKSQRKLAQGKKRRHRHGFPSVSPQRQAMVKTDRPVSQLEVPPSTSVPTPLTTLSTTRYPYIGSELRRIGILAGIILALLIVLFFVYPSSSWL